MNQNQNLSDRRKKERRAHRAYAALVCVLTMTAVMTVPALAADDPLSVVTSLLFVPGRSGQVTDIWIDFSGVMTGLLVGLILLGYGILQVGLSLQSHDPSQRSNGILTIAGGIVITFTKEILTLITGG